MSICYQLKLRSNQRCIIKVCHPRQPYRHCGLFQKYNSFSDKVRRGSRGSTQKNKVLRSDFERLSKLKDLLDPQLQPLRGFAEDDRLLLH